ncbi:integrase [Streptomyces sp. NPDC057889]|uniref:integrase n=1 Tax=unclassified Streptomyces TaxID=2593676 RepID=UPI0036AFC365
MHQGCEGFGLFRLVAEISIHESLDELGGFVSAHAASSRHAGSRKGACRRGSARGGVAVQGVQELAATGGASTRELMHRMGHSSVRAALTHQHLVNGRDHLIADYVDGQIRKVKRPPHGPSGM